MKKNTIFMCLSLGLAATLTSCSFDNKFEAEELGETGQTGKLTLNVASGVEFATGTRAVDESTYQNTDNYTVNITDNKGNSKFSGTFATLKTRLPLELDLGSYNISASYGNEYAASRDGFKVEGKNIFTIQAAKTVECNVACAPTAGKILVEFDPSMATYCALYDVDFTGTAALGTSVAHWGKDDTAPYYLAINEGGETVNYTIHLTAKADYAGLNGEEKVTNATATGSFTLERNKAKKLTVGANYTPTTDGGLKVVVEIDESTNDKTIPIEVPVTWI